MQKTIVEILQNTVDQYPDKIAIIHKNECITFRQLNLLVRQYASHLVNKGVKKGDPVLIFVPMSIALYQSVMAVNYIGAQAVLLDEWVNLDRMEVCCRIVPCKAIITIPKARILYPFSKELRNIPIKLTPAFPANITPQDRPAHITRTDTSLITFTTGTTGIPKAAKRTYGFLSEQLRVLIGEMKPHVDDICLVTLPVFTFMNLAVGLTTCISEFNAKKPENLNPKSLLNQLRKYNVTHIVSSPHFILKIADHVLGRSLKVPFLKSIYTGGSPVFPSDASRLQSAFPDAKTIILYGSTEAEPISSINANELRHKLMENDRGLDVGKIVEDAHVKIIRIIDKDIVLKEGQSLKDYEINDGEIGEIIVTGKHVLKEYYNTALFQRNKIIEHGEIWHRTGDAGFIGKDHNLYLAGRAATMLRKAFRQYPPFVVEAYFRSMRGILAGTLIEKDNEVIAVIELEKNGNRKSALEQITRSPFKFDRHKILKSMPRDPRHYGKIDYDALLTLC